MSEVESTKSDFLRRTPKEREIDFLKVPKKVSNFYKNGKSDFIGPQADDITPILYLSGTAGAKDWDEAKFTAMTGARFRCFSYAYVGIGSPMKTPRHVDAMKWCLDNGVRVFLDSGAHSFHNMKYKGSGASHTVTKAQRDRMLKDLQNRFLQAYAKYVKWCYSQGMRFDWYCTFDAEKDVKLIRDYTDQLFDLGVYPAPVYHGDASLDWLKRYLDEGHKIVGVGIKKIGKPDKSSVMRYFTNVIRTCNEYKASAHGFAVTGDYMFSLPWYSVDSTTYLKAAAYGKIVDIIPEKQRVALIHVSTRSTAQGYGTVDGLFPSVHKYLRDKAEVAGFDWDLLRTKMSYRAYYNAKTMIDAIKIHGKQNLIWTPSMPIGKLYT